MIGYFAKHVENLQLILILISKLLKKNIGFDFNEVCIKAFNKVNGILNSSPVLLIADPKKKYYLEVDSSLVGIGAVLMLTNEHGKLQPVSYFSKKYDQSENLHQSLLLSYEANKLSCITFVLNLTCKEGSSAYSKFMLLPGIGFDRTCEKIKQIVLGSIKDEKEELVKRHRGVKIKESDIIRIKKKVRKKGEPLYGLLSLVYKIINHRVFYKLLEDEKSRRGKKNRLVTYVKMIKKIKENDERTSVSLFLLGT
uniref:RT_RNaseH_2 domain-containing protein n=1 Tax=Strongyloides venezuelensis TaxID=75913 RepID=A0A0K0F529_STRVS